MAAALPLLASAAAAFVGAVVLTLVVRAAARRYGIVARPRQDRWHRSPTALLGGVGIYGAFLAAYLAFGRGAPVTDVIVLIGTAMCAVGLIDDVYRLKPYAKLVVQVAAAGAAVSFGLRLPWTSSDALDALVTVVWLVGITNAVNLLDNMDGLAAGITAIAAGFLLVNFVLNEQYAEAAVPAALIGAALGFLVFNFHPASIFMGDSGSMFVGFVLAATALASEYGRSRGVVAVLSTPVLILLLPIFDTCLVTATRRLSGRAITRGGRDHTSHRLVALGMSERRAVLTLYGFAGACGALAVGIRFLGTDIALLLIPAVAVAVLFVGLYLGKLAIYDTAQHVPPESTVIRALADFHYKRRVFEVLLDGVLVALAYYASYLLRFDGALPPEQLAIFVETLPFVIAVQLALFLVTGLYRGLWRYVGIDDLLVIARAVGLAVVAAAVPVFALYGFRSGASRVVFVLEAIVLFLLVTGTRVSFRLLRRMIGDNTVAPGEGRRPILIYGAGDGGELLVREILNNGGYGFAPVGFIDDDTRKVGKLLHGLPIYHGDALVEVARRLGVTDVVVSSSKVSDARVEELREAGVTMKRMRILVE